MQKQFSVEFIKTVELSGSATFIQQEKAVPLGELKEKMETLLAQKATEGYDLERIHSMKNFHGNTGKARGISIGGDSMGEVLILIFRKII